MKVSVVGISVNNGGVTEVEEGFYRVAFWLALKVDPGSTIGVGTSPKEIVFLHKPSFEEAMASVMRMSMEAQRLVKDMDLADALGSFPGMIIELWQGEEPKDG